MPAVTVDGAELFYVESGSGVPCIVLHGGLGIDHSSYAGSFRPLEDTVRFVYLDQRGNGRSERVPLDTITIERLAADVDALREHLGIDRVGVIGHSYGGFVALEYATSHPDRVSHLVALSTSPGVFEPTRDELAERPDPAFVTPERQDAVRRMYGARPSSDEGFAEMLRSFAPAYLKDAPASALEALVGASVLNAAAFVRGLEALDGWSVADRLGRVRCPTLVACGRYDLLTTPECSKRLATAVPEAELVWFERSGHFPWLEEPDAFFEAVRGFFARHP